MATRAGVPAVPDLLHVQEGLAVRVRDPAVVPAVLAVVNDQAMAGPAVAVVLGSVVVHMVPATAPMRLQMARHVTPHR
jgi:hypothetical protein